MPLLLLLPKDQIKVKPSSIPEAISNPRHPIGQYETSNKVKRSFSDEASIATEIFLPVQ
jgi:hypothetical protein